MKHTSLMTRSRLRAAIAGLAVAAAGTAGAVVLPASLASAAPPVAAAPAVAAAPLVAGPVSTGGLVKGIDCTAAACDLYAEAGSVVVDSLTQPVWNFTTTDTAATGSSPVIEAVVGDTLTVTLHNKLGKGVPVALSVPALGADSGFAKDAVKGPDYAGVADGGTATYTFKVSRAGTFTFQAGHLMGGTGDAGPRETAMGLVGAIVVRPAAGATTDLAVPVPPATVPASDFTDEAVLVLTEVDPAFAAAPLTYDLRKFTPAYRLINGAAWPETTQIGSLPGHKVLLRYVNAGVGSASMGVLGARQTVVAVDGYPSTGQQYVADTIAPGSTEDTVVTVGSAPIAVYDTTGTVTNNGHDDGTVNKVLAFGGRLTYITPSATGVGGVGLPVTGDTVGPVTSGVGLSPNPASTAPGSPDVTLTATFTDASYVDTTNATQPGTVAGAEWTLSAATGVTFGTPFTTITQTSTPGTATGTTTIPLSALASLSGPVKVYVRAVDGAGNWGGTVTATLTVASAAPKLSALTFSPDPTNGKADVKVSVTADDTVNGGTISSVKINPCPAPMTTLQCTLTIATPGTVVGASGTIPAAVVAAGTSFTLVATDSANLTGSISGAPVLDTTPPTLATGTVITTEPAGPINGTVGSATDPTSVKVNARFVDPAPGVRIKAVEGFFNPTAVPTAADYGKGLVFVAADGAFNSADETTYGLVPLTEFTALPDGTVTMYVHALDAAGNWGTPEPVTITVDRTKPTVDTVTAVQQAGVAGTVKLTVAFTNTSAPASSPVVAAEYFLGTTDPGAGNGTALTPTSFASPFSVNVTRVPTGSQTFYVRVKDAAGNWSTPVAAPTITVYTEPLFTDTFGTSNTATAGNSTAWAARTTGSNAPTYPLATTIATTGNGMNGRFVMFTANNSGASNVTTPTTASVGKYYARFLFRPGTLATTSTGGTDIVALRNGTTVVGSVQYRRVGTGAVQMRAVIGNTAPNAGTTAWTTIGAGANVTYSIQLTWTAGTAGNLVAVVNNGTTVAATLTSASANNNTARVTNAVLGTSNSSGTVSNRAWFDYFTASAVGLPAA